MCARAPRCSGSRIRKDRILTIARATLGPVWASSRAKFKKADLARAMEEAFAADPPAGLNPKARAAALAWTPPGFTPFDTGRMEEAGGEEDIPPAGESESDNAETVDDETPDAAGGEAPARGELARAVDALNAVPTADGGPRVIVHQGGIVNGHEGGGRTSISLNSCAGPDPHQQTPPPRRLAGESLWGAFSFSRPMESMP